MSKQVKKNNIFLTGFMGSGKTTVGKLLAKKLKKDFYDLDKVIEDYVGLNVDKIIEKFGFDYFRKIENQKLAFLCTKKNMVVSLGGGSLINKENIKQVKNSGFMIYLLASEVTLAKRLEKSYKRPLMKEIQKNGFEVLFHQRLKGYLESDMTISTDKYNEKEVVGIIYQEWLENHE